jgi:hypothetical protein
MDEIRYNGGLSGWRFDYQVVPGSGLVLRKVSNANYRLARDMRVIAVWIGAGDPSDPTTQPQKLRLGDQITPANGDQDNPTTIIQVPPLPADFNYYRTLFGVSATFATPVPVLGPGSDVIAITQDYQFAPYGIDPPHEPGGVLTAARLLPLVSFKCDATGPATNHIRYVRIDYRLNHTLDVYTPTPHLQDGPSAAPLTANQAGIFRDSETFPVPVIPYMGLIGPSWRTPKINDVFEAAEKPLQYEIVGPGLVRGKSLVGGTPATWDNIHQWPVSPSGDLPSTPGAFHAAHMHWRWGAVSGDASSWAAYAQMIPAAGPTFRGFNWTPGLGGPLVDRRIPVQTFTFAITADRDPAQDPDLDVSTQSFRDYFLNKNTPKDPKNVSAGADLIQWLSIEVFRDPQDMASSWEGTVLIHGLYFAHGLPPTKAAAQAAVGDLKKSLLKPTPNPVWERAPS